MSNFVWHRGFMVSFSAFFVKLSESGFSGLEDFQDYRGLVGESAVACLNRAGASET